MFTTIQIIIIKKLQQQPHRFYKFYNCATQNHFTYVLYFFLNIIICMIFNIYFWECKKIYQSSLRCFIYLNRSKVQGIDRCTTIRKQATSLHINRMILRIDTAR
jgi:hypothetical protein